MKKVKIPVPDQHEDENKKSVLIRTSGGAVVEVKNLDVTGVSNIMLGYRCDVKVCGIRASDLINIGV